MWQSELAKRFDSAGNAGAARVRVGNRPHLSTVAIVVWDPRFQNNSDTFESVDCEDIEDASERTAQILEDAGFGTEEDSARVDFMHAETGKLLPGWAKTQKLSTTGENLSVESVLAEALRANNQEIRRMFSMVCETLQVREERIDADRDELIDSRIEAVESRAEAELTQILAEEYAETVVETDPLKEQAGVLLQGLAQQFFGQKGTPRETVLAILQQDSALTAQLAGDPEVVSLFQAAIQQEAENALQDLPEEPGVEIPSDVEIEDPAPPSPMPE